MNKVVKVPKISKKKEKLKVIVKIFVNNDGDEGEILRQFTVKAKDISESKVALDLCTQIEKKFSVEDIEAWTQ